MPPGIIPTFKVELLNTKAPFNPANLSASEVSLQALDSALIGITISTLQEGVTEIDADVNLWYLRLKNWVPSWFWEKEGVNTAHFYALAKLLDAHEKATEMKVSQTFITQATGRYLDHLAAEWGYTRLSGESDADLRDRIRSVSNNSSRTAIELILQSFVGSNYKFFEWSTEGSFFDKGTFLDTGTLVTIPFAKTFWIYLSAGSDLENISAALLEAKAAGTSFLLVEAAT